MDGLDLLNDARAAGLVVTEHDGRLRIRGPREAEAHARRLLAHKDDILVTLRGGIAIIRPDRARLLRALRQRLDNPEARAERTAIQWSESRLSLRESRAHFRGAKGDEESLMSDVATTCPRCGSNSLYSEPAARGPHPFRLWCRGCGKFVQWLKEPLPPAHAERLATFTRGDGVELRVKLARYEGHPYIALRVWERNRDGRWFPVKGRGVSIRVGECDPLAAILKRIAAQHAGKPKPAPDWQRNLPSPTPSPDFNEEGPADE